MTNYRPIPDGINALHKEARTRKAAADQMADTQVRPVYPVNSNEEEVVYKAAPISNFTKGLSQDDYGIVSEEDYLAWVAALSAPPASEDGVDFDPPRTDPGAFKFNYIKDTGEIEIPVVRKWESPLGGLNSDLVGAATTGVAMAAAPPLGSSELCAEMAEVYAMALMRDISMEDMQQPGTSIQIDAETTITVQDVVNELNNLSWFDLDKTPVSFDPGAAASRPLNDQENRRRQARHFDGARVLTARSLFRGSSAGAQKGPYLSQLMLQGTRGNADGEIIYGSQSISQKSRPDAAGLDYMTEWAEWLDIQRGASRSRFQPAGAARFLSTVRDMAAYVHVDQLYQAYFNACLVLFAADDPFDAGLPNTGEPNREGFATYGAPHLLSLFTQVSSPALRAVRRQKFQVHRRARPEVLAARITLAANGKSDVLGAAAGRVESMLAELQDKTPNLMDWVNRMNKRINRMPRDARGIVPKAHHDPATEPVFETLYLLPMAFPEGSPMHASYGAGHATVAGACVTVLKAFLNTRRPDGSPVPLAAAGMLPPQAAQLDAAKEHASLTDASDQTPLTVEGELDKLAANISIARNFAGVHYYSDYYESLRMGERVAVGLLLDQLLTSPEDAEMTFHDFDGQKLQLIATVASDPDRLGEVKTTVKIKVDGASDDVSVARWWREHLPDPVPFAAV